MELMLKNEPIEKSRLAEKLKVKMFSGSDHYKTECDLNEWLNQNQIIVRHTAQSQCERNGKLLFVVTVFYSDHAQKN